MPTSSYTCSLSSASCSPAIKHSRQNASMRSGINARVKASAEEALRADLPFMSVITLNDAYKVAKNVEVKNISAFNDDLEDGEERRDAGVGTRQVNRAEAAAALRSLMHCRTCSSLTPTWKKVSGE